MKLRCDRTSEKTAQTKLIKDVAVDRDEIAEERSEAVENRGEVVENREGFAREHQIEDKKNDFENRDGVEGAV